MITGFIQLVLFWISVAGAAWPESPWLNEKPKSESVAFAVAFGSPLDVQFLKLTEVWKKLNKKYASYGIGFVLITKPENILPFNEKIIHQLATDNELHLPIFIDYGSVYSNKWRAYVSPTVNLVLKNEKVISFDPGNFDPFVFEKNIIKILKENGVSHPTQKEYNNEGEYKNCPASLTYFLGNMQKLAWSHDPILFNESWTAKKNWIEPSSVDKSSEITMNIKKAGLALIADALPGPNAQIKITAGDNKPTFIAIKSLKAYEVFPPVDTDKDIKITLQTSSKNLRLWALQTFPLCRNYK